MKWSTFLFVSVLGLTTTGLAAAAQEAAVVDVSFTQVYKPRPNATATLLIEWGPIASALTRRGNLQGSVATLPLCACNVTFQCQEFNTCITTTPDIVGNVRALQLPRNTSRFLSFSKTATMPWPSWKKMATFGFHLSPKSSVTYLVACENDESGSMRTVTMESTGENCPAAQYLLCDSMGKCEHTMTFRCRLSGLSRHRPGLGM
jgi:hypothetical protein